MNESSKLWSRQFTAIVIMAFLFFLCIQLLTAGFPAYITDVKNNPTQGGLMTTAFMVAAIVTRPLIGYLIHQVNVKIMSVVTLVFIAVTVGLSYGQDSIPLLLFLRVLHGIGFGVVSTIISTMATNIIPIKRLGEGVGYYGLATSVGTSLAPMLALSVLQFFSYNILIVLSILLTIAALVLSFVVKAPQKEFASNSGKKKGSFKEYAFDKQAFLPCILTSFFTISLGGVISFLKELGKEADLGGSVSLFFLIMAVVMTVIRPLSGRMFDRFGHKVIIYPAALSGIIGLFLLAITENTLTLLVAAFFYGISYGTVTPTLQAIAVSLVTKEKQGTANAMYFSSMDLGMAVGSTGLGVLASYTGYHFIYGFSILFLVALLITYTLLFVKGRKQAPIMEEAS
jgi:MFS family permease